MIKKGLVQVSFIMVILFVTLQSCTNVGSGVKNNHNNEDIRTLYLIGDAKSIDRGYHHIIDQEELLRGGYVVILPFYKKNNFNKANSIRFEFHKRQVMAVHILDVYTKDSISISDQVAIENARLICIVGDNTKNFIDYCRRSKLLDYINVAYNNSTALCTFNDILLAMGEQYVSKKNVPKTKNGLGYIENSILSFIRKKSQIESNDNYKEKSIIEVNNSSCFAVYNGNNMVMIDGKTEITLPENTKITLERKGEIVLE